MALMTVHEFCGKYGQNLRSVQSRLKNGRIPGHKEGTKWMVDDATIMAAITKLDTADRERVKVEAYDKVILRPNEVAAVTGLHRVNVSQFQMRGRLGFVLVDGIRCCTINQVLEYLRKRYRTKKAKSARAIRPEVMMMMREIIDRELYRPPLPPDIESVPKFEDVERMVEALRPLPEPERTYELENLWRQLMREAKVTRRVQRPRLVVPEEYQESKERTPST